MKPAIRLAEGQGRRLAEIAARLDIAAETLAEAAVRESSSNHQTARAAVSPCGSSRGT